MKDFLEQIEEIAFEKGLDEFETGDCVICLEGFTDGDIVKRIPTCRHFFHKECCDNWF